ncbi:MAG TPA: cation:dicarboxylase symporter family transporter [Chitinophagaceae bacterium]|jgi:proton glutamate symport protein|nr:cation:dicarboxylase symporter family transporter [Chitinophagaceae bacterium]HMU57960.1 cation:dicarboxylase symporter family transporter [Chitinophagaceae bacterium]
MNQRKAGLLALIVFSVSAIIHAVDWNGVVDVPLIVLSVSRWAFVAALCIYSWFKKSLTAWIMTSMVLGVLIGVEFREFSQHLAFLRQIFLNLVKTIVAPLLFSTLVVGIAGHSNLKQVGRLGWKSLLYFEVVTTIALIIGIIAINVSQAGVGIVQPEILEKLPETKKLTWDEHIVDIFPTNFVKAIFEGKVLQIVVFSVLFAIGLAMLKEEKKRPMLRACESLSEAMFKFTNIIMYFAPVGIGAAMAVTVGHLGIGVLENLFKLVLTLYAALLVFLFCVLLPIAMFIKIPVKKFVQAIREPVSIAFATTSSDSALPKAMENMEKFGVPRKIVSFVIPTGYTFNLDGTTLYLSLASVFVAQAANMHMSIGAQITMGLILMLTSKGVAAVPRASLVILIATAEQFHLPLWPIAAIFGIDELMDMARTSVNVIGNTLASCVVARWEGEFDDKKALAFNEHDADAIIEK